MLKVYRSWRREILSWIVLVILILLIFLSVPWVIKCFLDLVLSKPFESQRVAISKSNKSSDTVSGVIGTYVNNIPFSEFQKLTNLSSRSFERLDIQIPKIQVTSPIFDDKELDRLQDIWINAINDENLKEEFGSYRIFYDGDLVIEDGVAYHSDEATANEVKTMKKVILTELSVSEKFKKYKFKKWHVPTQGTDPTRTNIIKNGFSIESVFEVKDWIPDFLVDATKHTVKAEFTYKNNELILQKDTLEVIE